MAQNGEIKMSWENLLKTEIKYNYNGPNVKKLAQYAEKIRLKGPKYKEHTIGYMDGRWLPDLVAERALLMLDELTFNKSGQPRRSDVVHRVYGDKEKKGGTWYINLEWKPMGGGGTTLFIMVLYILQNPYYTVEEMEDEDFFDDSDTTGTTFKSAITVKKPIDEMTEEEINKYANMVDWRNY